MSSQTRSATTGEVRGPARVLVVVDQPVLAGMLELTLNHGQYVIRTARDMIEAAAILAEWQPHFAVVDMDVKGSQVMALLRGAASEPRGLPVIALTRRGDLKTKLAAFEQGADDILTLPFSPEELVARSLVVMRRSYHGTVAFAPVIRLGELEIDILNHKVQTGNFELHLTSLEQSLLYLLAANAGRLLSREQILDSVWGVDYLADSNVVDRHVRGLRAKLRDNWRRPRFIETVPGRGYRFLLHEGRAGAAAPGASDERIREDPAEG